MGIHKALWFVSIAIVVSVTASVATICVVLPKVVSSTPTDETTPAGKKHASEAKLTVDDPPAGEFAAEQDREAVDAIKQKLGIDVFSGTLFDDVDQSEEFLPNASAEEIASQALADTAEQLRADGQPRAAELVRAAAAKLRDDPVQAATAARSTKSR